jgi:hypothetical protein
MQLITSIIFNCQVDNINIENDYISFEVIDSDTGGIKPKKSNIIVVR